MMKKFLYTLFLLFSLTFSVFSQQLYPVKIDCIVKGPVVSMDDMRNPVLIDVNVALKDLQRPSIDVEVFATISSTGGGKAVTATSLKLQLFSGLVYTLNASELIELFYVVISDNTLYDMSVEGVYVISFQAYEMKSHVPVSNPNTDFAIVNVASIDPPFLVQPANDSKIMSNQNIFFSWNAPVGALRQDLRYALKLVKVEPFDLNPNQAILSDVSLSGNSGFEDLLYNSLNYDNTPSGLVAGAKYAWQVQAYELINTDHNTKRFKNQGNSPVYTFTVQEVCDPIMLEPVAINDAGTTATISWTKGTNHTAYELKYRRYATYDPWTIVRLEPSQVPYVLNSTQILPNKDYEYTVSAKCVGWQDPVYGQNFRISKDTIPTQQGECLPPLPEPIYVTRIANSTNPLAVKVEFASQKAYKSYRFTWWPSDAKKPTQPLELLEPRCNNIEPVADGQLYNYQIDYICDAGTFTGSVKSFRIESVPSINIAPGTANCFPPATISAQKVDATKAHFEWDRVSGAAEYQLVYALEGSDDFKTFTTTSDNCRITDLTAGSRYTYMVRNRCGTAYSIFSAKGTLDMNVTPSANCDTIPMVAISKVIGTEVQLKWSHLPLRTGYCIYYKELNQKWSEQYTINLADLSVLKHDSVNGISLDLYTIDKLNVGTTYQFKVVAACDNGKGQANNVLVATTTNDEKANTCGSKAACNRTSQTPIPVDPIVGSVINIFDFSLTITEITKSGNLYSGTGTADLALIDKVDAIPVKLGFTNLLVNDANCVIGGHVDVTEFNNAASDLVTKITDAVATVSTKLDEAQAALATAQSGLAKAQGTVVEKMHEFQGGGEVGSVKTGSLAEGTTPGLSVGADGKVTATNAAGGNVTVGQYNSLYQPKVDVSALTIDHGLGKVTFSASTGATYAFDVFQKVYGTKETMSYKYLKIDTTYFSAKAIVPGAVDYVKVSISDGKSLDDIHFINRDGFEFIRNGDILTLAGGPAKDAQEILAVTGTGDSMKVHGALLLASYPKVTKKVKIIPVGTDATVTAAGVKTMEDRLNKIYNPIGISYTLTLGASLLNNWCPTGNCPSFRPTGSAMLSNEYTGDEAQVIKYYTSQPGFVANTDTAYFFAIGSPIVNGNGHEGELQGKMNFNKQCGFLYGFGKSVTPNYDIQGRVLGHELAHGEANMFHIFDDFYLGETAKTCPNLMSYSTSADANKLNKVQWDIIHNPGKVWGILQSDKDAEAAFDFLLDGVIGSIKSSNIQGLPKTYIKDTWAQQESKDIILGYAPELPTKIEYSILKYNVDILSSIYKKEIIGNSKNIKVSFYEKSGDIDPVLVFKLPILKVDDFINYLGINDLLAISGTNVSMENGNIVALIGADLKMPKINLSIKNPNNDFTEFVVNYAINCKVNYSYPGGTTYYDDGILAKTVKVMSNKICLDFGNILRGGDLVINWQYGSLSGTKKVLIRGENPSLSVMKTFGSTVGTDRYWFFWYIMKWESTNRQFMSKIIINTVTRKTGKYSAIDATKVYNNSTHISEQVGMPLWGYPKGYGLKQLDNWNGKICGSVQRWNWQENIKGGLEVLECKINEMKLSPHLTNIKSKIVGKEDNLIMDDFLVGDITFGLVNSSFFPDWDVKTDDNINKKSFLDANFIVLYNGKGHIISKIEEIKEKIRDNSTGELVEIIHYKIVIDNTKTTYLNNVLK